MLYVEIEWIEEEVFDIERKWRFLVNFKLNLSLFPTLDGNLIYSQPPANIQLNLVWELIT